MEEKWIGIDLDGTLSYYEEIPGRGLGEIGEPIPLMLQRVKKFIAEGRRVKIFTVRANYPEQIPLIKQWLIEHDLGDLEVTSVKDHYMTTLYDDRAQQVIKNIGMTLNEFFDSVLKEITNRKE
jgi:hypothetical protein